MKISTIISRVNGLLAGEIYPYEFYEQFLDEVIDDINGNMNAVFPSFSEVREQHPNETDWEYTAIPDNYIRTVVIKGCAAKFYTMDEEGIQAAAQYDMEYNSALFLMLRDYLDKVPAEYRGTATGAVYTHEPAPSGWHWGW